MASQWRRVVGEGRVNCGCQGQGRPALAGPWAREGDWVLLSEYRTTSQVH